MGEVGITFGQIAIGTTKYGGLRALSLPSLQGQRIIHTVSNSTSFPIKELGHGPTTLSGMNLITAASVDEFVIAVRTGSAEQKISFMIGATEYYVYAYSGDITRISCINPYGSATRQYEVSWIFPLSRTKVYKGSDDSVLWGS